MQTALREWQYAVRRLRGSPMFTIAASVTLAIAIGATASVFGLVDGVLLKAFPFRDPGRVLTLWSSNPGEHLPQWTVDPPDYLDWRSQNRSFTELAALESKPFTITGRNGADRVGGAAATPNFFSVLGITPRLGRVLAVDSGGPAEVALSYGYWEQHYGGSRSVLGQTLILDDHPYTIVGVMPPGIPYPVDVWTRLSFSAQQELHQGDHEAMVFGRLKSGVTRDQAQRDMALIAQRLAQKYPETDKGWSVVTVPVLDQMVGGVRPALLILLVAAACVLVIGAANLANLFLVRCLARERDIAIRTALGASRSRLVRELLVEAGTLGVFGGVLGVGVAVAGVRALRTLAPPLPRLDQIGFDGRVIAFCALASITTVLIFGVLPAWQVSRGKLADLLKAGGRGTHTVSQHRLQHGLAVLQVAVALVLLTGAGLMVESFEHFADADPGFRPDGVVTAQVDLPTRRYADPARQAAFVATV
ncbi:MAG: ABC transporter permease, partial [Solirubrobacteraceae bacterium]